jgi:hypothetical protein
MPVPRTLAPGTQAMVQRIYGARAPHPIAGSVDFRLIVSLGSRVDTRIRLKFVTHS